MSDAEIRGILDEIRTRAAYRGTGELLDLAQATATAADVPPLLAALDAVLELAGSAEEVRDYSGYETHGRVVGWSLSPTAIREAISAALLGEGGDGG